MARRLGTFATLLLGIGLFGASSASAAYQQVGNFAGKPGEVHKVATEWPEEVQLGGLGGMAVNYTGAGGVPAGTIYAATYDVSGGEREHFRIARYNPDRSFSEAWAVNTKEEEEKFGKHIRCGPDGEVAHPNCAARPGSGSSTIDVEVDQSTGNVYALYIENGASPGKPAITEYSPDGSEVIARFGEQAASTETIAESPEKIHTSSAGGIAVNDAGEVYVFDHQFLGTEQQRLMVFKPKVPGDYTEYEYAGVGRDLGTEEDEYPNMPVIDAAGDVFTAGASRGIEKYEPGKGAAPVCSFSFKKGQITAMTVNPKTEEVFFFSFTDRKLHRLNPCDSEGKFSEAEALKITPTRNDLGGMAVDPERSFGAGRPAGILYAGAPEGQGGEIEGESSMGYIFAPPLDEVAPLVVSESVSSVTSSSARLEGTVNPRGTPSRYRFQYLSEAAYQANEPTERFAGALEVPLGGGLLEGSANLPVGDAVSGLAADTTYRYRIVATSHCSSGEPEKECIGEGEAKAFRTYPSEVAGLPDNRAWELVSPAQKNGGQVIPADPGVSSCVSTRECKPGDAYNQFPMQSAPDGNAISYMGNPFSFDEGALIENQYIAHRTATGWRSVNPTPSRLFSKGGGGYQAFKADLSLGVLEQRNRPLSSLGPPEYGNIYAQPTAEPGSLTPLLTEAPPNREPDTSNGLQLSFAGASADFSRLFFSANDALTPEAEGGPEAKRNLYERSGGELHLVNFAPGNATTVPNASFGGKSTFRAISQDGSRAFFSDESGQLYVRIDGTETQEATDHAGRFLTASADGSKALLDDGCLYVVEVEACEDLTQGEGGFEGIAGQSEDLARIYFVDTKVLSGEEENEHGDKAQAGKFNLYAWDEGETAFIATLLDKDNPNAAGDWAVSPQRRSAAASPDGSWLTFLSMAPLTGFNNTGLCEAFSGTEDFFESPCVEVFLYQAQTGELRCASCNRTGAPPLGSSHVLRLKRDNLLPPRYLTDSGRLFFDSQDSLSPFDTNGRVEDVYEFEPNGVGGCTSAEGCVRLISAGRSGVDSNFFAADPSGRNVFFTSRDKLVGADKDDLIDLYDAREGGGFPPDPGPAECQGEACLPSVSPPNDPTPGSAGFKGPGNQAAGKASGRCPKGRHSVKRKGKPRCVKSTAKRKHHKRHNNRGGAK